MTLKRVLGTMLASRMAGRGGARGGLGTAAILGMLGGGRRGGIAGKAGLAGLAYMAYQAYQGNKARTDAGSTGGGDTSGGGIAGALGDLANRVFGTGSPQRGEEPVESAAMAEAEQEAAKFSDAKALLLIRAMITAANADGRISPAERARIMQRLDEGGADDDDRRVVEREMENPRSLDQLLAEVSDKETAQEVYLASRAALDGDTSAHRGYLLTLRQRLDLSQAEADEIESLA